MPMNQPDRQPNKLNPKALASTRLDFSLGTSGNGKTNDDWPLRSHEVRSVIAGLGLIAEEVTAMRTPRAKLLGERMWRIIHRITDVCTPTDHEKQLSSGGRVRKTLRSIVTDAIEIATCHAGAQTRVTSDMSVDLHCAKMSTTLFRIIANLSTNAVQALNATGGGTVRVAARLRDGSVVIDVMDDGPGLFDMPAHAPEHDGVTQTTGSSGIGLIIVNALAVQIGASLQLPKTDASGTTFRLVLDEATLNRWDAFVIPQPRRNNKAEDAPTMTHRRDDLQPAVS